MLQVVRCTLQFGMYFFGNKIFEDLTVPYTSNSKLPTPWCHFSLSQKVVKLLYISGDY